jgi:hypothetical protein
MQAIERSPLLKLDKSQVIGLLKLDKSQVIGYLKATGSRDPDVLHVEKSRILVAAKFPKHVGLYLMIVGALCTVMILLAPIGIPLLGIGWWLRSRGKQNVNVVEAGFAEFVGA